MSDEATVELTPELEDIFTKIDALPLGQAAKLVKAMEERVGQVLFKRSHSGVELTPAGQHFRDPFRSIES